MPGEYAGRNFAGMHGLTEHQVFVFLLQFAILLAAARLLGALALKLGQASVLGELLAGILLGPAILGHLAPGLSAALFPDEQVQNHLLEMLSWLGMIFLIFRTGLEVDLKFWRFLGKAALFASLLGIVVPFLTGFGLGRFIPGALIGAGKSRTVLSLFLAIAMSISAVKVIAKTLLDLKLMRRNVGATILAASITDDTIGWILLSVVSSIALTGSVSVGSVMKPLGATAGVILFAVFLGRPLVRVLFRWAERARRVEYAMVSAIVVLTFAFAAATEKLGIHAVFGAFVAGVLVTDSPRFQRATLDALDSVILGVFAPIFFVYTGLRVTTLHLPPVGITAAILAIALVGKVIGSGLGAKLGGLGFGASLAVGIGMSSRGSMELVVARIGLDLGVLTPSLYAAIVLIPIITSFTTPALLRLVVSTLPPQKSEAERLEREEETKEALITREGAKILVAVSGGERSTQALRFAAAFAQTPGATLVAMSVVPQATTPPALVSRQRRSVLTPEMTESTLAAFEAEHAVPDFKPRIVTSPSPVAAIEEELQQGYDLVFVGAGRRRTVSNRILSAVLGNGSANAVLLYAYGQSFPRQFKRVLVATDGGFAARGAAELAVLYAESTRAELHATSVVESGSEQLRAVRRHVLQDVATLASRHDVAVQQRLQEGTPAPRILAAAQEASADLIVLGAVPQALGRQVYLGNTVETVLRHTSCAVALFIPRLSRAHA